MLFHLCSFKFFRNAACVLLNKHNLYKKKKKDLAKVVNYSVLSEKNPAHSHAGFV